MQAMRVLVRYLQEHAGQEHYIFSIRDFRTLFPKLSDTAFKTMISRTAHLGYFERVCRGLYAYKPEKYSEGVLLFHIASYLRSHEFNYLSLESVLSELGIISQLPMDRISLMSSGRTNTIDCGRFGSIEFIHTEQKADQVVKQLTYDTRYKLWRADASLALRDLKKTRRNLNLVDWSIANELIR